MASVAYVDPGNFATNFAGGAEHGYELVWVIVMANLMAILVQYLTSKAGLATGRSLPELCRDRFGRRANVLLWLQAEVVAMATDLAEFVGAAVGLNLVFGVPLFVAGLITAVVAFVDPGPWSSGATAVSSWRSSPCWGWSAAGFVYLFLAVGGQHYGQLRRGLVPRLGGADILGLTVGIIGATVMPHVVYLHSALQKAGSRPAGPSERRTLLRPTTSGTASSASGLAGLVNLSMLCIAAALFHKPGLTGISDLGPIHAHLAHPGRRRGRAGLRRRPDGLGPVLLQRRHLRRPGRHGRLHELAHPAAGPPRADHGCPRWSSSPSPSTPARRWSTPRSCCPSASPSPSSRCCSSPATARS